MKKLLHWLRKEHTLIEKFKSQSIHVKPALAYIIFGIFYRLLTLTFHNSFLTNLWFSIALQRKLLSTIKISSIHNKFSSLFIISSSLVSGSLCIIGPSTGYGLIHSIPQLPFQNASKKGEICNSFRNNEMSVSMAACTAVVRLISSE